jgi:hypothetical protein
MPEVLLNQEEIDRLSLFIEDNFSEASEFHQRTLASVFDKLPDSEDAGVDRLSVDDSDNDIAYCQQSELHS